MPGPLPGGKVNDGIHLKATLLILMELALLERQCLRAGPLPSVAISFG